MKLSEESGHATVHILSAATRRAGIGGAQIHMAYGLIHNYLWLRAIMCVVNYEDSFKLTTRIVALKNNSCYLIYLYHLNLI